MNLPAGDCSLLVDGADPERIRELLEVEINTFEDEWRQSAKIWEAAGGYSPTIGILGAVMGLIHVMENLSDPTKLGAGIAVAFVATIYGVGLANLVYLPDCRQAQVLHRCAWWLNPGNADRRPGRHRCRRQPAHYRRSPQGLSALMARRRREEEHENHERWLVSYADFITLLFAFFVVMYAISSVNEGKYKVLSNSLTNAFKNTTAQPGGQPIAVTIQGAPLLPVKPDCQAGQVTGPGSGRMTGRVEQRQKMKNVADDIMECPATA